IIIVISNFRVRPRDVQQPLLHSREKNCVFSDITIIFFLIHIAFVNRVMKQHRDVQHLNLKLQVQIKFSSMFEKISELNLKSGFAFIKKALKNQTKPDFYIARYSTQTSVEYG